MTEFPTKRRKRTTLNDFLKHLKERCTNAQKGGSGRPRTSRTAANTSDISDLVLSQEGASQAHLTLHQIARKTGIHRLSVVRIIELLNYSEVHVMTCNYGVKVSTVSADKNQLLRWLQWIINDCFWTISALVNTDNVDNWLLCCCRSAGFNTIIDKSSLLNMASWNVIKLTVLLLKMEVRTLTHPETMSDY